MGLIGGCFAYLLPDEADLLERLTLNATDAARVCGTTVRQLTYWTDKGIIPAGSGDGRSYDIAAVNKTIAIKQAMLQGYPLEKAAQLVEAAARMAAEESRVRDAAVEVHGSTNANLDAFVNILSTLHKRLHLYLAVARLRRGASELAAFDLSSLDDATEEQSEASSKVAMRLDEVATLVESTVQDLSNQVEARRRERNGSSIASVIVS
jgi:DNA-binding transcriptional MerR regulator